MNPERWEQVKELFDAALERQPDRRHSFLATACAGDDALRTEVERLLSGHDRAGSFLAERPEDGTASDDESSSHRTFAADEVIGGRFRVRRFLGRGGMGEVYEAEDLDLRVRVALKSIRPEISADPHALSRFKQEIQLARRVTHPNVCRIFDLEYHQPPGHSGKPAMAFLTMELLEGESLATRLRRDGKLAGAEALPLIRQMAEGLAAAHEVGVIHRDFKPGNVMLVPPRAAAAGTPQFSDQSTQEHARPQVLARHPADAPRAVITDFGLAGTTARASGAPSPALTSEGQMVGTLPYMAPEQLEGGEVTPATDVYALGLVMYEMLTGRQPFDRATPLASAVKRLNETPAAPRSLEGSISPELDAVITKCLQRRPEDRYPSAQELAADLRIFAATEIPAAARWAQRARLVWRRAASASPLTLVLVSAVVVLVCAAMVLLWFHRPPAKQPPGAGSSPKRLAVLPFENLSAQPGDAYFAGGLTAELTTTLTRVRSLEVISRTSTASFKGSPLSIADIAKRLDVGYVVSGSVQREGPEVRIMVSLEDVSTGVQMWARDYDRSFNDVLKVQSEVANNVVESLALVLGAEERTALTTPATQNPQAFDAYLRGKSLVDDFNNRGQEVDYEGAEKALHEAVALDPGMSEAYAEQAWLYFFHDLERARLSPDRDRARKVAEQALALDPRQVDALGALAMMNALYDDNEKAYDYAQKVLALSPHEPRAIMVRGACFENWGLLPEALQAFREAGRMDPLYIYPATNAANVLWMLGRFDEAWAENQKAGLLERDNWSVLLTAVRIRYHQGRLEEARQLIEGAEPRLSARERPLAQVFLAWISSREGDHQQAREILRSFQHSPILQASPNFEMWLAEGLALENQKQESLDLLDKVTKKIPNYPWLARDENLDNLKNDARFVALLTSLRAQWEAYKARYGQAEPSNGGPSAQSASARSARGRRPGFGRPTPAT
ncbi:MAG TPA: protein kinase [Terriglobia bacterium]|nr:protein kinase [Terriglobia bacterium]